MPLQQTIRTALGPTVRRWRKRLDNPELRQARLLVNRLRNEPPDVLHMGASESFFVAPYDTDQRTLMGMTADLLSPELSLYSVAGPGYHPKLFMAYLNIVATTPVRPVVVLASAVRLGVSSLEEHPEYKYDRSLRALTRVNPDRPPWRFHSYVPLATDAEFTQFETMPYPTIEGTRTMGEFRLALKDKSSVGMDDDERLHCLFAFHHGSSLDLADPYLSQVRALGDRLRQLGLPVVVYQTPIPVERAVEVLGEEVRRQTVKNWALLDAAFIAGYGPIDILQTGASLPTDEFIDPDDGTEHVNERGRMRMAQMIADAVRTQRQRQPETQR